MRLSEIREISGGESQTVVDHDGKAYIGKITGLDSVKTRLAGNSLKLNFSNASSIELREAFSTRSSVDFSIEVRRGGELVGELAGSIPIEGLNLPFAEGKLPADAFFNSENGHVYQLVRAPAGISWSDARKAAQEMRYQGAKGHLVTITTAQENAFLKQHFVAAYALTHGFWLGAYQDPTSKDYREPRGAWQWVTGEAWDYSEWGSAEPNDATGAANYANTFSNGTWNDTLHEDSILAYIVEFDP
jgi:hypothetical protein